MLQAISAIQPDLRRDGKRALLIGNGTTLAPMKEFATNHGIADLVEFAGEIPNAGAYVTCGRTLVAPSRWEGMPYLLLEAVARRRKIIASDCPGNRDVLKDCASAKFFGVEDVQGLAALMKEAE